MFKKLLKLVIAFFVIKYFLKFVGIDLEKYLAGVTKKIKRTLNSFIDNDEEEEEEEEEEND